LTQNDYQATVNGAYKKGVRDWEHTRFIAWQMSCLWAEKPEQDFSRFYPMDGSDPHEELTEEKMNEILTRHQKLAENGN